MMVAFYPHFVSCGEKATLKDVVGKLTDFQFNYFIKTLLLHFITKLVFILQPVWEVVLMFRHTQIKFIFSMMKREENKA